MTTQLVELKIAIPACHFVPIKLGWDWAEKLEITADQLFPNHSVLYMQTLITFNFNILGDLYSVWIYRDKHIDLFH